MYGLCSTEQGWSKGAGFIDIFNENITPSSYWESGPTVCMSYKEILNTNASPLKQFYQTELQLLSKAFSCLISLTLTDVKTHIRWSGKRFKTYTCKWSSTLSHCSGWLLCCSCCFWETEAETNVSVLPNLVCACICTSVHVCEYFMEAHYAAVPSVVLQRQ